MTISKINIALLPSMPYNQLQLGPYIFKQLIDLQYFVYNQDYNMFDAPLAPAPYGYYYIPIIYVQSNYLSSSLSTNSFQSGKQSLPQESILENFQASQEFLIKTNEKRQGQRKKVCKRRNRREKFHRKRERLDNYQRKQQKKDRNLPSNILKGYLNHIFSESSFHFLASKLQPQRFNISYSILIPKLKSIDDFTKNYIRPAIIKQLCNSSLLSLQETLFLRMSLKYYLKMFFPMTIIRSIKLKKKQRVSYLNVCRKLQYLYTQRQVQKFE